MEKYSNSIKARFTARHQKCINLVGNVKRKKILNIGCYNGWFEQMMVKKGAKEIVGIDTNEKFIIMAQKNVPEVKFFKMSVLGLNFSKEYFDLITMFDVIEHLPKGTEVKAFKGINKILKANGKVVVSTPNNHFLANILDPAWYFGHRHYKEEQLKKMLGKSGFKIEKMEKRGGFFEMISAILLYIFKWIFRREVPFKKFLEQKRDKEYLVNKNGFMTIFIKVVANEKDF